MARKPRCQVCNSKRWHRDGLSGSIVCEEGHLLQGYLQESTEAQEASQHVTTRRSVRKGRAKKVRAPANAHYHGERALFLQAQCMQLILRYQLHTLVAQLGYPRELEHVVRDLWALLCASGGVPAAPRDYARGEETQGSYMGPREGTRYTRKGTKGRGGRKMEEGEEGVDGSDASVRSASPALEVNSSDIQDSEDDADEEQEPVQLPSQQTPAIQPANPAYPTPHNPAAGDDASAAHATANGKGKARELDAEEPVNPFDVSTFPPNQKPWQRRWVGDPRKRPRMDHLLLLVYLGCVTLRLPVFLHDIVRLAETQQIVYLNARQFLPADMQAHLGVSEQELLNQFTVGRGDIREGGLQLRLSQLVCMYRDDWGLTFPEPNIPLITWRVCRQLAAPPHVYEATQKLVSLLPPLAFTLPVARKRHEPGTMEPTSWLPSDSTDSDDDIEADDAYPRPTKYSWRKKTAAGPGVGQLPEVIITAAVVVALKLLYPLGEGSSEPSRGGSHSRQDSLPLKGDWLASLKEVAELGRQAGARADRLCEGAVEDMTGAEIDEYLDFVENVLVPPNKLPKRMADIDRHFPSPPTDDSLRAPGSASHHPDSLDMLTAALYRTSIAKPSIDSAANYAHYAPLPYDASPLTLLPLSAEHQSLLEHASAALGLTPHALGNPVSAIEHLLHRREQAASSTPTAKERLAEERRQEAADWRERRAGWQTAAQDVRRARAREELERRDEAERKWGRGRPQRVKAQTRERGRRKTGPAKAASDGEGPLSQSDFEVDEPEVAVEGGRGPSTPALIEDSDDADDMVV